jgi:hypothetical protein
MVYGISPEISSPSSASEVKARLLGNPEKPTIARFCLDCLFKVLNLMIVTLLPAKNSITRLSI